MKKILPILLAVLMLAGCKTIADIRPDTIVDIPLHPTEIETQPVTEGRTEPAAVEQTEPEMEPTLPETQPPTQLATEAPTRASGGSSGGKKPSGGNSGKNNSGSKAPTRATKPTAAPSTEPPTPAPTEPPTEAPTSPPSYDPSGYVPGNLDRGIAEAVNGKREEAGLPPLNLDTRLCAIASVRAWEASRVWSQSRPDGSAGISVLDEYGYGYAAAAQNLYFGTGGAASVVDKWMSSESRRENILMESASAIGVGSCRGDDGLTYIAAFFAG